MLDSILQDFRFAFRRLLKDRGFTITAVLTAALAIGANTAIFTLVHAVMFQSLPVNNPDQLYRLGDGDNCCVIGGYQGRYSIYSYPLYLYLRDHTPEFQQMTAFQGGLERVGVRRQGPTTDSSALVDEFVSGNYFATLGVRPFAGRLLTPADDTRGAPPVAVISYRAWSQQYGSDPSIVGSTFVIDGAPFTITGVAAAGFFGDTRRPDPPDFWLPLSSEPDMHRQNALLTRATDYWVYIIGRLQPGAALPPLEAKVNAELKQWLRENDPPVSVSNQQDFDRQHITLAPAGGGVAYLQQSYSSDLRLLMGITGMVLLLACANLANLQLARGAANRAQASIRVALGAPRARLVRQTLTESIVLALMGGILGLLVATAGTEALVKLAFRAARFVPVDSSPSLAVLGFSFLLSLLTGVIFGVAPAWSASRADPAAALRGAGRSTRGHTTLSQKVLVAVQVAVSLVLLTGAGLLVETLSNLSNQRFGYQPEGRVVVNVNAAFGGYVPEKLASTYSEIERRMSRIAGVSSVSLSLYSPMEGNNWQLGISLEDRAPDPARPISSSWDRVSPRFFDTIGARVVSGRMFDDRDTPDTTHVAVVNQAFADKFLPNLDPLGRRFGMGGWQHRADYQIVGVVENVRFRNPRAETPPMFFLPLLQMSPNDWKNATLTRSNLIHNIELRTQGDPKGLGVAIQRALDGIDPRLTLLEVTTIQEQLNRILGHEGMVTRLTELFGLVALLLASLGIYGVASHSVTRRTAEIGIRMALGASGGTVVRMILRGVFVQILLGVGIGIPLALLVGRVLSDQLFGVRSSDPRTLAAVVLVLLASAVAAGWRPALRASQTNPVQALRSE